jgi:hypothetical protein
MLTIDGLLSEIELSCHWHASPKAYNPSAAAEPKGQRVLVQKCFDIPYVVCIKNQMKFLDTIYCGFKNFAPEPYGFPWQSRLFQSLWPLQVYPRNLPSDV